MPVPDQTRDEKKSLFQLKPPSRRALCAALWIFCGSAAGLCLAQNSPNGDVLQGSIDGARIWCVARNPLDLCITPGDCG